MTWFSDVRGVLTGLVLAALIGFALVLPASAQGDKAGLGANDERSVLVMLRMPAPHFNGGSYGAGGYSNDQGRQSRHRVAEHEAAAHHLKLAGNWPMPLLGLDCFIMQVPDDRNVDEAAKELSRDPGIEWAEPLKLYKGQGNTAAKGDPLYPVQPDALKWHLADLHLISTGKNARVAIIDSQVDLDHPDLKGRIFESENFVQDRTNAPELHGTAVAGVIAAIQGNGVGIVGVAPDARLMALRACWQLKANQADTVCDSLSLAKALHYAIEHKADIINMSLSGPDDRLLSRLIDVAQARGIVVVGAMDRAAEDGGFPASHPGVVAVVDERDGGGVVGEAGHVFGAPGRDIPTTEPGGRWYFVNGSSYAAAHISGLFALLTDNGHRPLQASELVTVQGGNAVDPCQTMLRALQQCGCECPRGGLAFERPATGTRH